MTGYTILLGSLVVSMLCSACSSASTETANATTDVAQAGRRDESLHGHGTTDVVSEEPQYVGIIGYATLWSIEDPEDHEELMQGDWTVPIYEKDKQFYNEVGAIPHKTEVLVLEQDLEFQSKAAYVGYLTVEDTSTGDQYIIKAWNFSTKPYWTYEDMEELVYSGDCIAEFKQVSDYYPVNTKNEKVELEDGTKLLVVGPTGHFGKGGPDTDENQIEAIIFTEENAGKTAPHAKSVFVNKEDLKAIY